MPQFHLNPFESLVLRIDNKDRYFEAVPHPSAPSFQHALEGRSSVVYHLRERSRSPIEFALKIFKSTFRDPSLAEVCARLHALASRPGLAVCQRICLTRDRAEETLQEFPALAFAILMPWISGNSWLDALVGKPKEIVSHGKDSCLQMAGDLCLILRGIESDGLAHSDLSASNVLFDPETFRVELVDVENFYFPDLPEPKLVLAGSPGYQHRATSRRNCSALADRFPGAILLSEMLGWYDESVQACSYGESFFDPAELHAPSSARLDYLLGAIRRYKGNLEELLMRAWQSCSLDECPTFGEWLEGIRVAAVKSY
jgi:serine/threonine protein kinase